MVENFTVIFEFKHDASRLIFHYAYDTLASHDMPTRTKFMPKNFPSAKPYSYHRTRFGDLDGQSIHLYKCVTR